MDMDIYLLHLSWKMGNILLQNSRTIQIQSCVLTCSEFASDKIFWQQKNKFILRNLMQNIIRCIGLFMSYNIVKESSAFHKYFVPAGRKVKAEEIQIVWDDIMQTVRSNLIALSENKS